MSLRKLPRQITLPGRGTTINVITSAPVAAWVGETGSVPVSNPGLTTKVMQAYKLGVIVPFSNELKRDASALYEALIERLPKALGDKFDNTVFGGTTAPGSNFDTFADVTGHDIATDAYAGLVAAETTEITTVRSARSYRQRFFAKGPKMRHADRLAQKGGLTASAWPLVTHSVSSSFLFYRPHQSFRIILQLVHLKLYLTYPKYQI